MFPVSTHTSLSSKQSTINMSSSSISAYAKAGIDSINRGEKEVDLSKKYVEIIICCCCLRRNNNN
jgi:hypothetical protein